MTDVAYAVLQAAAEPGQADDICARVCASADIEIHSGETVESALRARIEELAGLELLALVS